MSRVMGIMLGVAAGCIVGHALRRAAFGLNLTAITVTVAVIAILVSLIHPKLRVAPEDGIELDLQTPNSDRTAQN